MAATEAGRRLTDAHRIQQARLGASAAAATADMASIIDPTNIAGTVGPWLDQQVALVATTHQTGVRDAQEYLEAYRAAEIGQQVARKLPVVTPSFDAADAVRSVVWAPWQAQGLIGAGENPLEAWTVVSRRLASSMWVTAMSPGRRLISDSAAAHHGTWRRVSDGNPCAWCAMLVGRGAVYKSAATATGTAGRYHFHCGCTAEEVFGQWEPTAQEERYVAAYTEARSSAVDMDDRQVAEKMRQNGAGLFSDASKKPQRGGAEGSSSGS